jgi:hypothetical protein
MNDFIRGFNLVEDVIEDQVIGRDSSVRHIEVEQTNQFVAKSIVRSQFP